MDQGRGAEAQGTGAYAWVTDQGAYLAPLRRRPLVLLVPTAGKCFPSPADFPAQPKVKAERESRNLKPWGGGIFCFPACKELREPLRDTSGPVIAAVYLLIHSANRISLHSEAAGKCWKRPSGSHAGRSRTRTWVRGAGVPL